jgi:hypothetical protein
MAVGWMAWVQLYARPGNFCPFQVHLIHRWLASKYLFDEYEGSMSKARHPKHDSPPLSKKI